MPWNPPASHQISTPGSETIHLYVLWSAIQQTGQYVAAPTGDNVCQEEWGLRTTPKLTGDTRRIFVSNRPSNKTVDESNSARVLIGCKPITPKWLGNLNSNKMNLFCLAYEKQKWFKSIKSKSVKFLFLCQKVTMSDFILLCVMAMLSWVTFVVDHC